ncbi:glycerophosphodiester phosphodiesterase domain-containing protein 5 isoform X2 [Rhinatrema bivittatum]|uniref:glycerophosphodiester phosphodiesterase domain-containing protein 5 isoform X2 n=1 Tax=Rhinatrema bivittatum TaxID=194408 RepID=UPI00112B543D|nr:glycerophosphodiester phosphodiesterase domain-containing protein 5 isoform X2 [Rhinatrema bivittatum]
MVKHQPLQYYEPQLCLSCLTGIYGCRWKRYQRSHDDTTKWERFWFLMLTVTFLLTLGWLYFWCSVHNDYDEFNWILYNRTGYWSDWSIPILVTTAAGFTYIAALLILALCHVAVGQQLNLHWLHKATAPFLHIGALVAVTMLSWLIAAQFARSEKAFFQICIFVAYLTVLVALYLVPLTISSPCIMEKKDLTARPAVFGHRGAPMLAPENTLMSFQKLVQHKAYGLQADVVISHDGVPFLMHDRLLQRTTNVEDVFPELASERSSMLNWTDLERLNAGQWFLKTDPFWTVGSLSPSDYAEAGNQSICKLADVLRIAKENSTAVLLNFQPLPAEHPHRGRYLNITLQAILSSGIPQRLVMWLPESERQLVRQVAPGFQQTSGIKADARRLRDRDIRRLNLRYTQVTSDEIREYTAWNLSINLYTVNEAWLYSVLWCAGVQSVTSDASHLLSKVPFPIWLMTPDEYYLIWITSDLISFTVIIGVFILQKWRLGSIRTYNPEQIMLSAAVRRTSRDVKIMKEKLIFSEINNGLDNAEDLSLCSESRYDGYSNEVVTPMDRPDGRMRMD